MMQPRDLQPEQFAAYSPDARKLITTHLEAVRELPLSFVPSLLREVIDYDIKFPAERSAIEKELANLSSLSQEQIKDWFEGFAQISLPAEFDKLDWVNQPAGFIEQESAYLWTTHQQDAFRKAATEYGTRLRAAPPPDAVPVRRLGIAIIGQGVARYDAPLFRNLRAHGTYFDRIRPENGLEQVLAAAEARAKAHPVPYGHWYVDGGRPAEHSPLLTCVSYKALEPVRAELLKRIQAEIKRPGMGPEELRTDLAKLTPADLGMDKTGDEVLNTFQLRLFTEGSGTQIFSTTFAQWTAREALRRAQALTLLVRFAPRQRQRPMNELLSNSHPNPEVDPLGSLVDADMGASYQWINQQRLPGSEQSAFLAWFEGHNEAVVIAPYFAAGKQSSASVSLGDLLSYVAG
ncbi:MAG TPA: hypothetical protein VGS41_08835 [Chthonomonadales bacterium]|nr:hypothetical protein [Chthonomonadales bacterium]